MKWTDLSGAIGGINLCGLRLALRRPDRARAYLSHCLRKYDELIGRGLENRNPITYVCEQGWGALNPDDRVELPTRIGGAGGVWLDELLILATVTRVLRPKKVFEFGTYTGLTTSVFILNSPPGASVVTLDLPRETQPAEDMIGQYLNSDLDLIRDRKLAAYLHELHLEGRYQQVLCDSLQFDPSPHRGSVELGFIDGAHALPFVKNDSQKMSIMAAARGIVFWHDYGGQGHLLPLARYLEELSETIPVYRISGTSLAWTSAPDLRKAVSV